jgi:hypothetical protein
MALNSVTSAFSAFAQQVTSGGAANPNTPAAVAQEAAETPAATVKEAQHGDLVARKKLAKAQAQQQAAAQQAPASEPGKGNLIDRPA